LFEVGALIFKIQAAGASLFQRDMDQADKSVKRVEGSAKTAKTAIEGQGKATDETGRKSSEAATKQREQAEATERQVQAAKTLSLALIAAGAAVTVVVGMAVAKYADFDKAMSNTGAAAMATAAEQDALGEAALQAGAKTAYSATEAAAAQEELVKAGQSVSDVITGSLDGALSLAAAGQLQVARSAEIMATTLTQFRLPAEQAAHVSDVLAAGAGKAQGSVDDLALALSYVGPLAGSVGFSLNETAGTIAYFATQGILGEKAGTSLRGVLASLQAPSAVADKEMKKYSISMFDANGNMLSLSGIAEQLRTKLGGLTEQERLAALGRIFGNESLNAATLLYEGGAAAVEKWTGMVDDSGYAAEQAAKRQDNLAGDVEKLGGAFETALIRTGSGANDVLRDMVQIVTSMVDWYGQLPPEVHQGALVFGVLTGAVLLTSGAALGLTARFSELRVQLERNNLSMGKTAAIGGAVGLALAGVITVVALLAQRQAEARQRAQSYADTLEDGNHRITRSTRELVVSNLQAEQSFLFWSKGSAADAADRLGISFDTVTDAALGQADAIAELSLYIKAADGDTAALDEVMRTNNMTKLEAVDAVNTLVVGLREQTDALDEGKRLEEQRAEATAEGVSATQDATQAYIDAADGASDLNSTLQELIDTINEANGVGQDAITSNIDYQDSLAKVDETIRLARESAEGYSLTLDTNTEAGRTNMGMLVDLAKDAEDAARAQFDLDGNTDNYRKTLESSRDALIKRAEDLGYTRDQAEDLADQIFKIPSETEWKLIADTSRARTQISQFVADSSARTITIGVTTYSKLPGGGLSVKVAGSPWTAQAEGSVRYYANGGRENHVAQMARAGEWRVWAEDETGGESYVPHHPSKRARSEQIMQETAAILGGVYIPAGTARRADGAVTPSGSVLTLPSSDPREPRGPVDLSDSSIQKLARAVVQLSRVETRMGGQ
jgi:TP901 family phage tail tape measure protein